MQIRIITLFILLLSFLGVQAQEIVCEATVLAPDVSKIKADQKIFTTLEQSIMEFMNNRKWTEDVYSENERIEISILIAITEQVGEDVFKGTMTVISKRPAFNSSYNSTVLNIIDQDVVFQYTEFQAIEFNENQFYGNLGHMLGFYAYLVIGVDYDTFSEKGGTKYLEKAADIANVVSPAEAESYPGWKPYEKNQRNRYWVVTHMLNSRYENWRLAQYQYHRLGLDNFYSEPEKARENIKEALELVGTVGEDNPNLSIMRIWSETKAQEVVGIYKDAPSAEKTAIMEVLEKADPTNADKYAKIGKK